MTDIVFTSVPYINTVQAVMAPAVLKAIAERAGYTAVGIDLNAELLEPLKASANFNKIVEWTLFWKQDPAIADDILALVDRGAERILSYQPKMVGLSLLCSDCQPFAYFIAARLKQLHPNLPIIMGGSGIKNFLTDTTITFAEKMKSLGLVDHYITGDGEYALPKLLQGELDYPGIDTGFWTQHKDLNDFPYPNYDDYDWGLYQDPAIPMRDSNGCVRQCEFCDVIEHWTKYVYRTAENSFQEMLHQIDRYGRKNFAVRNALTNGNMKEFRKWVDLIANYNSKHKPEDQISWRGYFIIRDMNQHPKSLWEALAASNAYMDLGVESVIRHVRWSMGKKFENEDIDYHLEMGQKYKVPLNLLCMVAYPRETLEDYEYTKKWFSDRLKYAKNSVDGIALSMSTIIPDTKLDKRKEELQIKTTIHPLMWIKEDRPDITIEQKTEYYRTLREICQPFNANSAKKASMAVPELYAQSAERFVAEPDQGFNR